MAKARASRFLENLRIFETGVPALVGSLLGSVGAGLILGLVRLGDVDRDPRGLVAREASW